MSGPVLVRLRHKANDLQPLAHGPPRVAPYESDAVVSAPLEIMEAAGAGSVQEVVTPGAGSLHVRLWDPPTANPEAVLVLLHGVVSHSEWLAPVAYRLAAAGYRVVCPDRRGVALSSNRGSAGLTATRLRTDVRAVSEVFRIEGVPLHLGGFCWGATQAIDVLSSGTLEVASFIMIAPSIFPAPDIGAAELTVGDSPEPTEPPSVPLDRFTDGPAYNDYILPDPLRARRVSPQFNQLLVDTNRFLAPRWAKLTFPALMIQATRDRLADTEKHSRAFRSVRARPRRERWVEGGHGVQFDAPDSTADEIRAWLGRQRIA